MSLKLQKDDADVDPDELFTRCTIQEVKVVQQKLRAGADHKKQELRLMVGERYRDLLQASTSIMSIANSSQLVLEALDESKAAVLHQQEPPVFKGTPAQKDADTCLHALQQLAAHIKLLIDAPENLWRLIEQKKYFLATWLFLLVRLVHRALVRDDEEGGIWKSQGIDVLSQFPILQRQWDTISQFRSQIIHKATLSLREVEVTAEDACAALVTLHLLDSRPLTETFSVYLNQRSKTLAKALSRLPDHDKSTFVSANGYADKYPGSSRFVIDSRLGPIQEVKEWMQFALSILMHTIISARDIFEQREPGSCIMYSLLKSMQPGDSDPSTLTLPPELRLNTSIVLTTLPSSIQYHLLPADLKAYKPYVDLDSSSSIVSQVHLSDKLGGWLATSINGLEKSFGQWLEHLKSARDVWNIRSSVWKWVSNSSLREQEISSTLNILDNVFCKRILHLWRDALLSAEEAFRERLKSALAHIEQHNEKDRLELPTEFLFHSPPMPQQSQLGFGPAMNPFDKYHAALRERLIGRTPLLSSVLRTLESCAHSVQDDISFITSNGMGDTRNLLEQLLVEYRPLARDLSEEVIRMLEEAENSLQDKEGYGLAFLQKVLDDLGSSSLFIRAIGCPSDVAEAFHRRTVVLRGRMFDRWRERVVLLTFSHINLSRRALPQALATSSWTGPSPRLINSLITLSDFVLQFGLSQNPAKQQMLIQEILKFFISQYLADETLTSEANSVFDLAILYQITRQYQEWHDLDRELATRIENKLLMSETSGIHDPLKVAADTLARCQNLIGALLPFQIPNQPLHDKQGFLLPLGIPVSDTQYQSAIPVAKSGPRFGLLLVEGSFSF
ncbi:hypothetical protein AX17_000827 [Amanita inopinata Kibby_2008]|nr:hypothetical protein AX17_000827 [Amanita inopinata Kibby_2008]